MNLGVGVLRVIANLISLIDFNDLAITHNGNAVTQLVHQGQIVSYIEDREAELFSELVYLLQYFSLNDDIQAVVGSAMIISLGLSSRAIVITNR